jgi:thiol-disulfide isomerase/thioredoxin
MKKTSLVPFLLFSLSICTAQNQGSISPKDPKPKAGVTNFFIYTAPKNLSIPDKIQALVAYQNGQQFFSKTIRTDKVDNHYSFSFKAPDSTSVLVFSIIVPGKIIPEKNSLVREKKIVFDNNNENGFVIYLHNKNGKIFNAAQIDLAILLNDYAIYEFGLKKRPVLSLIKMYEDSYRLYPQLKEGKSYADYLSLLYTENENAARPKLLNYADQLMQQAPDEDKLELAAWAYRKLKMPEEKKIAEDKILTSFPDGKQAKEKFWSDFYAKSDTTEETILATMTVYTHRFNDNTAKTKDRFYAFLMENSITRKDWPVAFKYGDLINEKMRTASTYNWNAWKLSGKQIDNPGIDLENAKILSAKSIAISTTLMNDGADRDEDALNDLKEAHYNFYDTYALILYKLGQYDSAFYYQEMVSKQGKELNTSGIEKYAAYAEKTKGIAYTKQFIESKLLTGTKSPVMSKQLQEIYKELNLPADEFDRLHQISLLLAKQKDNEAIKEKYGTLQAPDFSLKNMAGETVTLSQLKNKIVVLDFWATWCVPCKASFPTMLQLVNKYKDDKDIVFLFIDTWESDTSQKSKEAVKKYMADNNYSFNVLFDVKKKVVTDYKVEEIPKKIVLDKNGNLVYTGGPSGLIFTNEHVIEDMSTIIDAAKKIPIDPTTDKTKLPTPAFSNTKIKQ